MMDITLKLEFVEAPTCCRWLAKVTVGYNAAVIGTGAQFLLNVGLPLTSDMINLQDIAHYMSKNLYMAYDELAIYLGGYEIELNMVAHDVSTTIVNGEEVIYQQVPDEVINGTKVMLFQLDYKLSAGDEWSHTDYVLGYIPVPVQPLYGSQRTCLTPRRQLFRGRHDSDKYNTQLREIRDDIDRMMSSQSIGTYDEYTDILKLEHVQRLTEMANGV